jgi:plastocyanin
MGRPKLASAVLVAAVTLAGCGSVKTDPVRLQAATLEDPGAGNSALLALNAVADMRGQANVTIETNDNLFAPQEIKVSPGTKITWDNKGFNQHNVTPVVDGQFEAIPTGSLNPGVSAERTLGTRGVYRYYCTIHGTPEKGQRAVIVVDS